MTWTRESIDKVLKEIHASVPDNLRLNVAKEVKSSPTIEFVMKKAVEMESIDPEKRKKIQTLLDNGEFSRTRVVEDPKIAKMIDNMIGRKINQAIKAGKLPNISALKQILKNEQGNNNNVKG